MCDGDLSLVLSLVRGSSVVGRTLSAEARVLPKIPAVDCWCIRLLYSPRRVYRWSDKVLQVPKYGVQPDLAPIDSLAVLLVIDVIYLSSADRESFMAEQSDRVR